MFNQPKLSTFTLCAMGAVTCWVAKDYLPVALGAISLGFACVLAGTAMLSLGRWMYHNWRMYEKMIIDARNDTWEVRLTRNIALLTQEQIDAWRDNVPILSLVAGEPWPIRTITLGGEQILFSFARRFIFEDGTDSHLAPIGLYSEGTKERRWAQVITGYMLGNGYAKPAVGPYPAAWVNRAQGIKSIGLEG